MATASSSFARNKDQKQSKKRRKGLNSKPKEPKTVDCRDKLCQDKVLKLQTQDQSLEDPTSWRLHSQEVVDPFAELYPELSQTFDESELDSEREESSEDSISSSSGGEDLQCVPGDTKEIIKSKRKRKSATKKKSKSKMEPTAPLEDSQVSVSSETQSQNSDRVKAKRKSRSPKKVRRKKVKQIKEEPDSDEELLDSAKEKLGSWAQCGMPQCGKWRYLKTKVDPTKIPDRWVCSMNPDPEFNTCDASQEMFDSQDENYDVVYSPYPSGSIVWAKLAGYPWWPAMMQDDPDYNCYYESRPGSRTPVSYHVVFFDKDVSRAWVGCANVRMFHLGDKPDDMASGKGRKRKNTRQLEQATEEAHKALEMPLQERLDTYGFAKRYNGPIGYQQVAEAAKSDAESEDDEDQKEYTPSSQGSLNTNGSSSSSFEETKVKKTKKLTKTKKTPRKTPNKSATKHKVPTEAEKSREETTKAPKKKQKPKLNTEAKGEKATKNRDKPAKPVFKCKKAKVESTETKPEPTGVRERLVLSEVVEGVQDTRLGTETHTYSGVKSDNLIEETVMDGDEHSSSIGILDSEPDKTQAVQTKASGKGKSQVQTEPAAAEIKSNPASEENKKPRKPPSAHAKAEKTAKKLVSGEASKKKTKKLSKEQTSGEARSETFEKDAVSSVTETISKQSGQDEESRKPKMPKNKKKIGTFQLGEGGDKIVRAEQQKKETRDYQGTEIRQTSQNLAEHEKAAEVQETASHSTCSSQQKNSKKNSTGKKKDQNVLEVTKGSVSIKGARMSVDKVYSGLSSSDTVSVNKKTLKVKAMPNLVKPTFTPPTNAKAQKKIPKLVKARFVSPAQKNLTQQSEEGKSGKENSPAKNNAVHKKCGAEKNAAKTEGDSGARVRKPREISARAEIAEENHQDCAEEQSVPEEERNERSFSSVEAEVEELEKEMEDLKKDMLHSESTEVVQSDEEIPLSHSPRNLSPIVQEYYAVKITDSPEF